MDNGACSYRRFLDGDDKGLVELVGEYKDGLILFLNGYVNNISVAEELTEETFFRLITKKPRYSGKSTFKSWLYAIGRNTAIDYIRHRSKMHDTPFDDMENLLSTEHDLEHSYIKEERKNSCSPRTFQSFGRLHNRALACVFRGFFQQRSGNGNEKE